MLVYLYMIYCSLDLEGTGLDPKKDAITEVGAVLFEVKSGELKFYEEFSQLVKPNIPIPKFIQELTNITEADVADAPAWEKVLPDFKKFVGNHMIVGQNIQFDLKFLEANGLPFTQRSIDTKDLASTFLPKAEFYNLEYLMGYLGITLETHHRALADSKSAARLLGQIVQKFQSLPLSHQNKVSEMLITSDLPYKELFIPTKSPKSFKLGAKKQGLALQQSLFKEKHLDDPALFKLDDLFTKEGEILLDLPWGTPDASLIRSIFEKSKDLKRGVVLSVGRRELFEQMKAEAPKEYVILDEDGSYFSKEKFDELSSQKKLPDSLVQFLIKLFLWNLEKEPSDDFPSLSLAGEEYFFRTLVSGNFKQDQNKKSSKGDFGNILMEVNKKHSKIFTLHNAWQNFSQHQKTEYDFGIFHNFTGFESALEQTSTYSTSLKNLRTNIYLLYDSETKKGLIKNPSKKLQNVFTEIPVSLDLCFGLTGILISENISFGRQRVVDDYLRSHENFSKVKSAILKLVKSFGSLRVELEKTSTKKTFAENLILEFLYRDQQFLVEFFDKPEDGVLYWVEHFNNQIKLKKRNHQPLYDDFGKFKTKVTTINSSSEMTLDYVHDRIAFQQIEELDIGMEKPNTKLFLPDGFPPPKHLNSQKVATEFLGKVLPRFSERTIVLFNSQKFLEETYDALPKKELKGRLFAQRVSGHQWKNVESFKNINNSIWLLTAHNFFRNVYLLPPTGQMIILRLPYEIPGIWEAAYDRGSIFSDFILPRTEIKLSGGLARFISSGETGTDKKIIFLDQRITEDYNEVLLKSLQKKTKTQVFSFGKKDYDVFI